MTFTRREDIIATISRLDAESEKKEGFGRFRLKGIIVLVLLIVGGRHLGASVYKLSTTSTTRTIDRYKSAIKLVSARSRYITRNLNIVPDCFKCSVK